MNFDEALSYMSSLLRFGWKPGNSRIAALCERLGNPQLQYRVVHIAGTKGKGSTTALAASLLHAHGLRTGAYFSPYVYHVCERVQVNGIPMPQEEFARLVTCIRPHIEALAQTELGQTTEFELKTALGFLYFAEQNVDCACIEVGLGGRLDATNIVAPQVTVITNIGLDHTEILGDTHALIAAEKAGILKQGIPCFTAAHHPDAWQVISLIAQQRSVPLAHVLPGRAQGPTRNARQVEWRVDNQEHTGPLTVATANGFYPALPVLLTGRYQRENAACALAAAECLLAEERKNLLLETCRRALSETALPGRMECRLMPSGTLLVLDGAHNEMAAEALGEAVQAMRIQQQRHRIFLVAGMVGGHDPNGVMKQLAPLAEEVICCRPGWKRAQEAEAVAEAARCYCARVNVVSDVQEAVQKALAMAGPQDMVLVSGSFYTVGECAPLRQTGAA